MKVLDRHLLRRGLIALLLILLLTLLLVQGIDLLTRFSALTRGELDAGESRGALIALFYLMQMPQLAAPLLPIATVGAALLLTAPMLRRKDVEERKWMHRLAEDYERPEHHILFSRALGRRLRRNYMWIFTVQTMALYGKCLGASGGAAGFESLHIGAVPGSIVAGINGVGFVGLGIFTWWIWRLDQKRFTENMNPISMG